MPTPALPSIIIIVQNSVNMQIEASYWLKHFAVMSQAMAGVTITKTIYRKFKSFYEKGSTTL